MSLRVTLRLLLLVGFLGGLLWLAENRFLSERPEKADAACLVPFAADDIVTIEIRRGESSMLCVRRGSEWWMERPQAARVDPAAVARLLGVVETLAPTETVTEAQRKTRDLTLADYGLDPPAAVVTFTAPAGSCALAVGGPSVVGDAVYVRVADCPDIHAAPIALLGALPRTTDVLRDRRLFRGEPFRTARIEVAGVGFMKLVRSGSRWTFQQPVRFRADAAAVNRLLDAIYGLKAGLFVWDPTPGAAAVPPRAETYGLSDDLAAMRIGLWTTGDEEGQELVVGKALPDDPEKFYARLRGSDSVYGVSRRSLDMCRASAQDLMDRDVFPFSEGDVRNIKVTRQDKMLMLSKTADRDWMLVEPIQWQADTQIVHRLVQNMVNLKVAGFLEGTVSDPKSLGFSPPWCSISLSNRTQDAASEAVPPETLLLSSVPPSDGFVLARYESGDTVFRLPAEVLSWFGADPVDPLAYRDRQILAVPSAAVNRISLVRAGVEQSVVRTASGAWEAVSPQGRSVSDETVADIVGALASLRSLRIEYHGPENLEAYGFDKAAPTLTVGISSGEGIRKTLTFGYRAGTDGRFVRLQGQDVIFVLDKALSERLTGDLVRPLPGEKIHPATDR